MPKGGKALIKATLLQTPNRDMKANWPPPGFYCSFFSSQVPCRPPATSRHGKPILFSFFLSSLSLSFLPFFLSIPRQSRSLSFNPVALFIFSTRQILKGLYYAQAMERHPTDPPSTNVFFHPDVIDIVYHFNRL